MKIVLASFQGVRDGIPYGVTKLMIRINEIIRRKWQNETKLFVGSKKNSNELKNVKSISKSYELFIKILSLLNRNIFKYKSFYIRFLSERFYDFFLYLRLTEPIILVSSAYLYHTLLKNKKLGGINIFISGNPDDREINKLLKEEKTRHDVNFDDAYTFEERINFISKSLDTYDHIICFSNLTYQSYIKHKNNVSLVNNSILPNPHTFKNIDYPKKDKLTFCYIAHPLWLKGLSYLLSAWSNVNSNDDIELIIGGRISNDLQKYINDNYSNLDDVIYSGWVEDINKFFRTAHVAIVPSLLDAAPTTVAEAMYCGLPAIVGDGCGSSNLIKNGENGFVVPSGDADAIAKKIIWFLGIVNN